jgi:hypothetical protein
LGKVDGFFIIRFGTDIGLKDKKEEDRFFTCLQKDEKVGNLKAP